MKKLFSFLLSLFVIAVMILFITVPQALSRSPNILIDQSVLIPSIELMIQGLDNQFYFICISGARFPIVIEYTAKTNHNQLRYYNIRYDIAPSTIRPVLLL